MTTYYTELEIDIKSALDQDAFDAACDKVYAAIDNDGRVSHLDMSSEGTTQIGFFLAVDQDEHPDATLLADLLSVGFHGAPELLVKDITPGQYPAGLMDWVDSVDWSSKQATELDYEHIFA